MNDFAALLQKLAPHVEFIIVGGVAATIHGASRLTQDIDIVYSRSDENIGSLAEALAPLHPYPRGVPPGLPFRWDKKTISQGLNFTLTWRDRFTGGDHWRRRLRRPTAALLYDPCIQC
jgi:hypothetical protein